MTADDLLLPPTIVISLDTPNGRTRMRRMHAHLRERGLRYRVLRGIKGTALTPDQRQAMATRVCSTMCTPSTIGCGASHALAWKQIVRRGDPLTIIIEDDTEFDEDIVDQLRHIIPNIPRDADVVMLGCFLCQTSASRTPPASQTLRRIKQFSGTHAYIVTQKGARTLLEYAYPVKFHLDMTMSFLARMNTLRAYSVSADVARQSSGESTSENVGASPGFPNALYALGTLIRDGKGQSLFFYMAMPIVRVGPYTHHVTITGVDILVFLAGALGLPIEIFVSAVLVDAAIARRIRGVTKAVALYVVGRAINAFACSG